MYTIGATYPVIVKEEGNGLVNGEVFRVTDEHLRALDVFEDVDGGLFVRVSADITMDFGESVLAFAYAYVPELPPLGIWS